MNKRRVVVSLPNANAYLSQQASSAQSAGAQLGFDVEVMHAADDSITQSQQLLKVIQAPRDARPCALLVEPLTGAGLRRVAHAAVADGIAWVLSNCDVDYIPQLRKTVEPPVFAVTQGQTTIGEIQGRQLAALLPKDSSVLYIHGPSTSPVARQRRAGMESTRPPEMRIASVRSEWNEESACRAVTAWLALATSRPEKFHVVAGQTHELALGARKAFEQMDDPQRKKWLDLPFIGVGIAAQVQPLVKTRVLAAAVVTSVTMGLALKILAEAFRSRTQPPECTRVPASSLPPLANLRHIETRAEVSQPKKSKP
jgi:ABC-type sugar transport system substrate-binding protein